MESTEVSLEQVTQLLGDVLQLADRSASFHRDTPLLGSVPEFDSMAVVAVITALEDNYGLSLDDDEITAEIFETVGSLQDFLNSKISA